MSEKVTGKGLLAFLWLLMLNAVETTTTASTTSHPDNDYAYHDLKRTVAAPPASCFPFGTQLGERKKTRSLRCPELSQRFGSSLPNDPSSEVVWSILSATGRETPISICPIGLGLGVLGRAPCRNLQADHFRATWEPADTTTNLGYLDTVIVTGTQATITTTPTISSRDYILTGSSSNRDGRTTTTTTTTTLRDITTTTTLRDSTTTTTTLRDSTTTTTTLRDSTTTPFIGTFVPVLRVTNLRKSHHGVIVSCGTRKKSDPSTDITVVKSCTLELYAKPQNPVCTAKKMGTHSVSVTCSASNVFPNLTCDITQLQDDFHHMLHIHPNQIVYGSQNAASPNQDDGVQTCTAEVQVRLKGKYTYVCIMWPAISNVDIREMSVASNMSPIVEISDESIASVHLRKGDFVHDHCFQGKQEVRFECEAFGFHVVPHFTWFQSGRKVSEKFVAVETIRDVNGGIFSHWSRLMTTVSDENDAQEVKCAAKHERVTGTQELTDSSMLTIRVPPSEKPTLSISSKSIPGDSIINIVVGERSGLFSCQIRGGRPIMSKIKVRCSTLTPRQPGVKEFTNMSNSIHFELNGEPGETWECFCSGQHVTGCYNQTSRFEVRFVSYRSGSHSAVGHSRATTYSPNPPLCFGIWCYFSLYWAGILQDTPTSQLLAW